MTDDAWPRFPKHDRAYSAIRTLFDKMQALLASLLRNDLAVKVNYERQIEVKPKWKNEKN